MLMYTISFVYLLLVPWVCIVVSRYAGRICRPYRRLMCIIHMHHMHHDPIDAPQDSSSSLVPIYTMYIKINDTPTSNYGPTERRVQRIHRILQRLANAKDQ